MNITLKKVCLGVGVGPNLHGPRQDVDVDVKLKILNNILYICELSMGGRGAGLSHPL